MNRFTSLLIVAAFGALVIAPAAAQKNDAAQAMLETAKQKETLEGDLAGAIKQYQAVVDKYSRSDRGVAAQSLVHMAECYQKLGDAQATKIYERIVREFGDQKEPVTVARARLGTNEPAAAKADMVSRRLWTSAGLTTSIWSGHMSPDGRYISFIDRATGNLTLHDLTTGADRRLTDTGTYQFCCTGQHQIDFAAESAISRDGKLIAYSWFTEAKGRYELRVLRLDVAGPSLPKSLFDNPDVQWIAPFDWSPDGKSLAVRVRRKDQTNQIGLIDTANGSLTVLKTIDWRSAGKLAFSPDGAFVAYDLPPSDTSNRHDIFVLSIDGSKDIHAVAHPASDFVVGWFPDGRALLFASDRTGSTGLWSLPFKSGKPQGAPELIKGDLGLSSGFGITRSGNLLYGVAIGGPVVKVGSIDPETGKTLSAPVPVTEIYPLPSQADWSPDGKYMVLKSRTQGSEVLSIQTLASGQLRTLKTPFAYISQVQWISDESIVIRAGDMQGRSGLYRIDVPSGDVSTIAVGECRSERCPTSTGTIRLIHSVSPDLQSVFYADDAISNTLRTLIHHDLASGRERQLLHGEALFGFRLSPDGRQLTFIEPDPATKSQALKVLSVDSGQTREVFRVADPVTLTNLLEWTPDGRRLLFGQSEGKKESTWVIPVAGGVPVKLDLQLRDGPNDPYRAARIHPDGHRVLLTAGSPSSSEVWTLENFLPPAATAKK